MKIFIFGHGKSGTTVFLFKVFGGLPGYRAFAGGDPGKHLGDYENAVYKHTYKERKGRSFDLYLEHVKEVDYERKIWVVCDPRNALQVAQGAPRPKKQYQAHL